MLRRIIYALIPAVISLFLVASCNRDDMPGTEPEQTIPPQKIRFNMVYATPEVAPDNSAIGTRVAVSTDGRYTNTWQEGDKVGVMIIDDKRGYSNANRNVAQNMPMTYKGGHWEYELPDTCTYYPKDGTLSFIAYFPYIGEFFNDPYSDISLLSMEDSGYNSSLLHFLYAKTSKVPNTSEPVTLEFSPLQACIELSVKGGNDRITAELHGCYIDFRFYVRTGAITIEENNHIKPMKLPRLEQPGDADYATRYTYRAFLPPQTIAAGTDLFLFKDGVKQWTYRTTEEIKLEAGQVKPLEITLRRK